ncbi:hypothetical protein HDU92_003696 [Lobulomyces angularis]|nr:hypothetical protein HDU92_003696 [Lobulomyces angularis]
MEDWFQKFTKIQSQLVDDRAKFICKSGGSILLDASFGGLIFFSGCCFAQMLQKTLRISSSTYFFPQAIGLTAVIASSILSSSFSSLPRKFFIESESELKFKHVSVDLLKSLQENPFDAITTSFVGLIIFRLLGGKFFSLAPSDFRNLGAFNDKKLSLKASMEYADTSERAVMNAFGRLWGCHTCGTRTAAKTSLGKVIGGYHADHQPPVKFAQAANDRFFNRILGIKVSQRYYPQCHSCSNQQGVLVKQNELMLKTHFFSLRPYHFTGFYQILMLRGVLKVDEGYKIIN